MKKNKNIQMPYDFFMELYVHISRLVDYDYDLDPDIAARCKSLESQVEAKLNAMVRRDAFTRHKVTASGTEECENIQHQYIELADFYNDWVSDIGTFQKS